MLRALPTTNYDIAATATTDDEGIAKGTAGVDIAATATTDDEGAAKGTAGVDKASTATTDGEALPRALPGSTWWRLHWRVLPGRCPASAASGDNGLMSDIAELPAGFLNGLRNLLGPAAVHSDSDSNGDRTVVRPASTVEVSAVVVRCAEAGVKVITRGGDTGLSGGTAVPAEMGSVTLSVERLNQIQSTNRHRRTITAGAGVTIQALQEAAAAVGYKFAPDWAARGTATIGGAIATNAGGHNVLRYGNMRDHVMGVKVVLADGRVWDGLRALRKDSSGYDLKQLFVGAEGTLGIVTAAVLKLVVATPHQQSALAAISGLGSLMPLLELAEAASHGSLTAFELMPVFGMSRVRDVYGMALPIRTDAEYCVLVKFASTEPVTDRLTAFLAAGADAGCVLDAVVAATAEQESSLWMLRDELSPTRVYKDLHRFGLKLDTAVPIDRIAECISKVRSLAATMAPEAVSYAFGHVGDGNLHMTILPADDRGVEPFCAVRPALQQAVDEAVLGMGGTLSAEHGIGTLLRDRIAPQKDPIEWELMRAVKAALDPGDLFNPQRTLPRATNSGAQAGVV